MTSVDAWLDGFIEGPPAAEPLPSHQPYCLGCGPDNPHAFGLKAYRDGETIVAEHVFAAEQAGSPGLAHGGAVALVCDDIIGFLLWVLQTPAVTRNLNVDYLRPVVLGERHRLRASLESRDGRKLWLRCEGRGPDGTVRFAAKALFIQVGFEHFLRNLPDDERARAEKILAEQRKTGEDASAW